MTNRNAVLQKGEETTWVHKITKEEAGDAITVDRTILMQCLSNFIQVVNS